MNGWNQPRLTAFNVKFKKFFTQRQINDPEKGLGKYLTDTDFDALYIYDPAFDDFRKSVLDDPNDSINKIHVMILQE